jgi:hypothetical protein
LTGYTKVFRENLPHCHLFTTFPIVLDLGSILDCHVGMLAAKFLAYSMAHYAWYSRSKKFSFPFQNAQAGEWQDSIKFSRCSFITDFWKSHFVNMVNSSYHYDLNPTLNYMAHLLLKNTFYNTGNTIYHQDLNPTLNYMVPHSLMWTNWSNAALITEAVSLILPAKKSWSKSQLELEL